MAIVIGIDVGISTTKIVGIKNGKVTAPISITAADPITSLYGAFGKYLHDNDIELKDVEQVMLTGVGAAYIDTPIYGLPTAKSEEFVADGLGAKFESKLDHAIVVSMGTGTTFIRCNGAEMKHIGGIGVGGGTLAGLARIMLNTSDITQVVAMAKQGNVRNTAYGHHGLQLCQSAERRLEGRHRRRTDQDGAAEHRFCRLARLLRQRHPRLRAYRQPLPPAAMQGSVPRA